MKTLELFDWVILDLETTGLNPQTDSIIEVAGIVREKDGKREVFRYLVDPGVPVPAHITRLTGISSEMLRDAPPFAAIKGHLASLLENRVIVAHNARFDLAFLKAALGAPLENLYIDSIELAKLLFLNLSSYSLQYLVRCLGQENVPAHRALDDALALEELFQKLLARLERLPLQALEDISFCLGEEEQGLARLIQAVLHHRVRNYDFLEDTAYSRADRTETNSESQREKIEWNPAYLQKLFEPGGSLAQGLASYRKRPQQIAMAKAVAKALASERHLLVEAGTGVGKTLAYLIPSIFWARSQNEKVVVATHTIALQEQIIKSDIKFLEDNLGISFKTAVLKGRNNYLCLQRWKVAKSNLGTLNWAERQLMSRISHWLHQDTAGDKDSISLWEWELEFFTQLASSSETCLGSKCPYHRECYYQKAKQKAQCADIIIVNHSLLVSDLKVGDAILPHYLYLIVDEAHHLEEEGTRRFSEVLSLKEMQKGVQHLVKSKDSLGRGGLLNHWRNRFTGLSETKGSRLKELLEAVEQGKAGGNRILEKIEELLFAAKSQLPETARIQERIRQESWWENLELMFSNLMIEVSELHSLLGEITRAIAVEFCGLGEENERDDSGLRDLKNIMAQLEEYRNLAGQFFAGDCPENVYWLENDCVRGDLRLIITPVRVGDYFRELLFLPRKSVILTSATLSVNGGFQFLIEELGLPVELVDTLQIPSPFCYDEQAVLLVDTSLPDPARTSEEGYSHALAEALLSLLQATGGNTLVLFTSKRQMKSVFELLWEALHNLGMELYADGINGSRHNLVNELKENSRAVVFGTNTFWEGIDLPGNSLTAVIMVKLPFQPPTLPLVEAKIEKLKADGKDGFSHYSLPLAVLKFKQGYGRLIRTSSDCGVVIVLDNRLVSKRYGKTFINSLPYDGFFAGNTSQLREQIADWFARLKLKA